MAVDYRILSHASLVVERWTGEISHVELLAHEAAQSANPDIPPGAAFLVDARTAKFATLGLDLKDLGDAYDSSHLAHTDVRCAMLVSNASWETAKHYEKFLQQFGVTAITFISLDVACTWLGCDLRMISGELAKLCADSEELA